MEIKIIDKELVERTISIIKRPYTTENEHDVTLLINCTLALIVLPIESTPNDSSAKKFRAKIVDKLVEMGVIKVNQKEKKLFRAIKNAISHMHIEFHNKDGQIDNIVFWDKIPNSEEYHTVLQFSPQQLKDFALFVAQNHLDRYAHKQQKL